MLASTRMVVSRFVSNLRLFDLQLKQLSEFWAKSMGISRPQWEILLTVRELDVGTGVSVVAVANHSQKQQSAVTRESKQLEKQGLLRRRSSETDARFVKMCLSDKASKNLSKLDSRREELDEFIFEGMRDEQLEHINNFLAAIETRLRKAGVKLIVDF